MADRQTNPNLDTLAEITSRLSTAVDRIEQTSNGFNISIALQQHQVEALTKEIAKITEKVDKVVDYEFRIDTLETSQEKVILQLEVINRWRWGLVGIFMLFSVFMEGFGKKIIELIMSH